MSQSQSRLVRSALSLCIVLCFVVSDASAKQAAPRPDTERVPLPLLPDTERAPLLLLPGPQDVIVSLPTGTMLLRDATSVAVFDGGVVLVTTKAPDGAEQKWMLPTTACRVVPPGMVKVVPPPEQAAPPAETKP